MTQAEKTMLRYQYTMAHLGNVQGDFIRTSNNWANVIRVLKQNLQNLGSTIGGITINAFKPFMIGLNNAILKLNEFAKVVANSLGKIFGWEYEEGGGGLSEVAEDAYDTADGLDDASASAKKLKSQLMGFDKLNVINSKDKSGSGSGSASGASGSGSDGTWKRGDSILKGYESSIDSLGELGTEIGKKLSEALEGIDWDKVYLKAKSFGTGLASFLNGLITPNLFSDLGETLANELNTVLYGLNSFVSTFSWKNFGESLREGLVSFFTDFDFDAVGTLIVNGIMGAIRFTSGLFGLDVDFESIKKSFNDLKESINPLISLIEGNLLKVYNDVLVPLGEWTLNEALPSVLNLFGSALDFVRSVLEALNPLADWLWEKFLKPIGEWTGGVIVSVMDGLSTVLTNIGNWVKEHAPFVQDMVLIVGSMALAVAGVTTAIGAMNKIIKVAKTVITGVKIAFLALSSPIGIAVLAIGSVIAIGTVLYKNWDLIKQKAKEFGTNIKNTFVNLGTAIVNSSFAKFFTDLPKNVKNSFEDVKKHITAFKTNVSSLFDSIFTAIKGLWNGFAKWVNDKLTITIDTSGVIGKGIQAVLGTDKIKLANIPMFADGGFPNSADLFYANENGVPELVGTMGGKTAVASGTEITGITDAIYETSAEERALMREFIRVGNALLAKDSGITEDDIFSVVRKKNQEYLDTHGEGAFAY